MKRKFQIQTVLILICLLALLIASCGGDDEEELGLASVDGGSERSNAPTMVPEFSGPIPTPSPVPVVTNESTALRAMWVHLTKCVPIEVNHLNVQLGVRGEWMVMPIKGSPQEFGTWRVNQNGDITPHNAIGELWQRYIESECDTSILQPAANDVLTDGDAVTTLWAHLARCIPEISLGAFSAQKDRRTGAWVVVTVPKSQDDFGVWSVKRDANIEPLNDRAVEVSKMVNVAASEKGGQQQNELAARCSPVIGSGDDARRRLWTHLSPCYPTVDPKSISTTWDPSNHLWVAVSKERPADTTAKATPSVWHLTRDGNILPKNISAEATWGVVSSGNC